RVPRPRLCRQHEDCTAGGACPISLSLRLTLRQDGGTSPRLLLHRPDQQSPDEVSSLLISCPHATRACGTCLVSSRSGSSTAGSRRSATSCSSPARSPRSCGYRWVWG